MKAPSFKNRWLITSLLTTEAELHIGDGGDGEIHDRNRSKKYDEESDAATVCVDYQGRAFLPGSSLKGVLRARVVTANAWDTTWEQLLGSPNADNVDAVGGKLVFFDAFNVKCLGATDIQDRNENPDNWNASRLQADQGSDRNRPYWDPIRSTCISMSNSLDRRTHTAKDQLLYSIEYVPAGETFKLEVGGENLSDEEVGRVLHLLETFNSNGKDRTTLGASWSNSWGKVIWTDPKVTCLANLSEWLKNPKVGYAACSEVKDVVQLKNKADALLPGSGNVLQIVLTLAVNSPWLIRDPRQRERVNAYRGDQRGKPSDAVPIHDKQGRPFDPAKSLRGLLRTQAEKILRTLELPCADHPDTVPPISTKNGDVAEALAAVRNLDLAAQLFGASGWQAPLCIPRLTQTVAPPCHHQEFDAIDRFTSGSADGLKFNADLAGATILTGTFTVNLDRLKLVDPALDCVGLLALVMRDLAEGDIPIGSGSAKGQGTCVAKEIVWNGQPFFVAAKDVVATFQASIKNRRLLKSKQSTD